MAAQPIAALRVQFSTSQVGAWLCLFKCAPAQPYLHCAALPSLPTQVSWLGAWALLLGCRDHKTLQNMMHHKLPCLRPSESDMLLVYQKWASIAAAAEVRGSMYRAVGLVSCWRCCQHQPTAHRLHTGLT